MKQCKYCKKDFEPKRHSEAYCSTKCREDMRRERNRENSYKLSEERRKKKMADQANFIECPRCKKKFWRLHDRQRFCSTECRKKTVTYKSKQTKKDIANKPGFGYALNPDGSINDYYLKRGNTFDGGFRQRNDI